MKNAALVALVALVVALGALGVALLRADPAVPTSSSPSTAPIADAELGRRVTELETEIARLRGEVELLRATPTREAVDPRRGASDGSSEIDARMAELERQLAELRTAGTRRPTAPEGPAAADPRAGGPRKNIDDWVRLAKSGVATEAELLEALRGLRGSRSPDGTDPRVAVLPQMIRLAEQSQDAATRADVWRQLSGVTDRSMLGPLLHALQNDPSGEVREEAAETLADFLPDPGVESALRFAAENDADPDVRRQALESLAGGRR